jgi:farnesyl diphosphate synthase
VWAAYDPATAILAGDALLTAAFQVLADEATHPEPGTRMRLTQSLASRSGSAGMVGGQSRDLEGEGRALTLEEITGIQHMKTGSLIGAAMEMGGILGGEDRLGPLTICGHHAGLAFQIADDILDATSTSDTLGKTAGKDAAQGKATVVAVRGVDGARALLAECVEDALAAIADRGPEADGLREVIRYLGRRES